MCPYDAATHANLVCAGPGFAAGAASDLSPVALA
jgi:hypothetical protein